MIALSTPRRHHRHENVCIRWRPDHHWLLATVIALVLAGVVTAVLVLSLWYAP